jgi:Ca-activated chloride channel family protein
MEAGEKAAGRLGGGGFRGDEAGQNAVEVAQVLSDLKDADRQTSAVLETRRVAGRVFMNISGVWIDQSYDDEAEIVRVEYLSDAYFQLLDREPDLKDILALGERVVWRTPSGKTLVIDGEGKEKFTDEELDHLLHLLAKPT